MKSALCFLLPILLLMVVATVSGRSKACAAA